MENTESIKIEHTASYVIAGILFGIVLLKSEVVSWFRIQEMFRLQSFHMYGVIGSAVLTGVISIQLLKKFYPQKANGEALHFEPKPFQKGTVIGALLFGIGWAITGACPGPIYALVGYGYVSYMVVIISALLGVVTYGILKDRLP